MIAIMQPTYLPWIGYFDLIRQADAFVFLDSVAFSKQSWQQRNRIKTSNGLQWLSVPVLSKGKMGQSIRDTQIDPKHSFGKKHLKSIELSYRKAPYCGEILPGLAEIYEEAEKHQSLSRLNQGLILFFSSRLGEKKKIICSGDLDVNGERSHLLVNICRQLGQKDYLSPMGAIEYLKEDAGIFREAGIEVRMHAYEHPVYKQLYPPFAPYASVLDLVMNEAPAECARLIDSGRRPAQPLEAFI